MWIPGVTSNPFPLFRNPKTQGRTTAALGRTYNTGLRSTKTGYTQFSFNTGNVKNSPQTMTATKKPIDKSTINKNATTTTGNTTRGRIGV
jgi:hypothetical protein